MGGWSRLHNSSRISHRCFRFSRSISRRSRHFISAGWNHRAKLPGQRVRDRRPIRERPLECERRTATLLVRFPKFHLRADRHLRLRRGEAHPYTPLLSGHPSRRLAGGTAVDKSGISVNGYAPTLQSYEFAAGAWLGRNELLKASYEILHPQGASGTQDNVFGFEFVVRVNSLGWAFR